MGKVHLRKNPDRGNPDKKSGHPRSGAVNTPRRMRAAIRMKVIAEYPTLSIPDIEALVDARFRQIQANVRKAKASENSGFKPKDL